ncbi:unnamed protein product [Gemmata massiliana]|uniref:Uncharacterized protein n=1 Tax=Gemmata massiliana TaxID=1210884 RepID=A0A6P2CRX2_9BACT|nr:unnamed protein product [Gemmata massiliana]
MESAIIFVPMVLFYGGQMVCHAAVAVAVWRVANALRAA